MPIQKLTPSLSRGGATQTSSSVQFQVNLPKQSRYGLVEGITNRPKRGLSARFQIIWEGSEKMQSIKTIGKI